MLFYECNVSYKSKAESRLAELANQPKKIWGDAIIQDMNDTLAENSADKIEIIICSAKVGKFKLVVGVDSLKKITEESLSKIFVKSAGGTIIIELRGSREEHRNYATCYEKVIQDICEKICKYQRDTLFIFVETVENPGFSSRFIKNLCKEGGLLEHSINVAETLLKIKNTLAPEISDESCVIVGLLHDLVKVGMPSKPQYIKNLQKNYPPYNLTMT